MKTKLDNRKGLSTVITTLIILVVAVLLAGVVTYYATNVVMTRTTQEEVRIRKPHIWVQEGDNAYAALMIQNLGGRDVLIDKITVRGVDCPYGGFEVIGAGDGVETIFGGTLSKKPIVPGSIIITARVSGASLVIADTIAVAGYPDGDLADTDTGARATGAINYETGVWTLTFAALDIPDAGTSITATYAEEGGLTVYYYLVQPGNDVSGDFKLKESASTGFVYAQIGAVPPTQDDWKIPISDMPLKSSGTMLFFIANPTNIALNDVGTTISLTVFTSNAQWIIETIVQAAVIEPVA